MAIFTSVADSVFAETTIIDDGVQLKNPKPIREAFVVEALRGASKESLREFVKTPHARALVENEIISPDSLETLTKDTFNDRSVELMVCHMAHENGDDRWDELVRHRAEERRLLNELIRDYSDVAAPVCDKFRGEVVDKYVPREYQNV